MIADSEARIQEAARELKRGNFRAAEQILINLLQAAPDSTRGWQALGNAYVRNRENTKAIRAYHKVVAQEPTGFLGNYSLGVTLAADGDIDDGIFYLTRANRIDPNNDVCRAKLATLTEKARSRPATRSSGRRERGTVHGAKRREATRRATEDGPRQSDFSTRPESQRRAEAPSASRSSRSTPQETELMLPQSDEEFADYKKRVTQKAKIDARAKLEAEAFTPGLLGGLQTIFKVIMWIVFLAVIAWLAMKVIGG
jgi:predicted Zn-dependent protease